LTLIYPNTNIFLRVWFEEEFKRVGPDSSEVRLLAAVIACEFSMVISNLTIEELERKTSLSREMINTEYLSLYRTAGKLRLVSVRAQEVEESRHWQARSELNRADIIHALVAKREQATIVTNDKVFHREAMRFGARAKFADEITRGLPF